MKISKFKIPKELAESKGLKEIDLTHKPLGNVVALAGINGSGKTRILEFVRDYYKNCAQEDILVHNHFEGLIPQFPQITEYQNILKGIIQTQNEINKFGNSPNPQQRRLRMNSQHQLGNFTNKKSQLEQTIIPQVIPQIRNLVQASTKFVNPDDLKKLKGSLPNNQTFKNLISGPKVQNEFDFFSSQSTLDYINEICTDIIEKKFDLHSDGKDENEIVNDESYKKFGALKTVLEELLNKQVSFRRKKNTDRKIIGEFVEAGTSIQSLFNYPNLSTGEKTLFAYGILFFFQNIFSAAKLKESIIIIDEPELNLHPSAQIKVLDRLRDFIGNSGQLWIATHSLHILSHLHHDEIIMVDNGEIVRPSVLTPAKTFNSLMGAERHIHKLTQFVSSISDWTYANFIIDCFRQPDIIPWTNKQDAQVDIFKKTFSEKPSVKLLDYGAGKGRVGTAILHDKELNQKIEYYYALEPEATLHEEIKKVTNVKQIFSDSEALPASTFDIVLLCNVLHEIEPQKWFKILDKIYESLHDNGSLIIIEDKQLPKGEKANKYGFLILDESQLKILFGYKKSETLLTFHHSLTEYKERILCALIPKSKVKIKESNILAALVDLEKKTYDKIKSLRGNADEKSSRLYAQQSQQYLNSKIAIEDLNILTTGTSSASA